jgi:hypothetical protein
MSATKKRKRSTPTVTSTRKQRLVRLTLARTEAENTHLRQRIQQLEEDNQQRGAPIEIIDVSSGEEDGEEEPEEAPEPMQEPMQEEVHTHTNEGEPTILPPYGTSTNANTSKIGSNLIPRDGDAQNEAANAGLLTVPQPMLWHQTVDLCVIAQDARCAMITVAPSAGARGLHSLIPPHGVAADWQCLALSQPFVGYHVFSVFDKRPESVHRWKKIDLAVRSAQYPLVSDQPLPALTPQGIDFNINIRGNTLSWCGRSTNANEERAIHEVQVNQGDCLVATLVSKAYVTENPLFPLVELRNAGEDDGLRIVHLEE